MFFFFLILLIISIFLEATVVPLPLVFICLLIYNIFKRRVDIFPLSFFAGFILDIVTVRQTGSSGLFFLLFFLMVSLYQRKYEISSYTFVMMSSFAGTYLYGLVFGNGDLLFQSGLSSLIALVSFAVLGQKLKVKNQNYN